MIEGRVYKFSKNNKPVKKAKVGEVLKFKTLDCFSNEIKSENDAIGELDLDLTNPAAGPVYIEGAEVGDTLVVDILDIEIEDMGIVGILPNLGPLKDEVEPRTKMMPIKDGKTVFNGIEFEVDPMIGVIGVAPEGEDLSCGVWGSHGGNMDNKKITKGTTIYLPVFTEGALLQMGDLHAAMGDGELCGTGIEIPGVITVRVGLKKGKKINRPIHETKDKWYTIANAETYDEALKLACYDMLDLLKDAYGWDATDVFLYLSIQGDIEICQGVKPSPGDMVVRLAVPKVDNMPLL